MEVQTSKEFGTKLQENNMEMIISIGWVENIEGADDSYPSFYYFDSVNEVISYFNKQYVIPFVLYNNKCDKFTKDNAILSFEEMKFNFTGYKYETEVYQFYNKDTYLTIKNELLKDTISHEEYYES